MTRSTIERVVTWWRNRHLASDIRAALRRRKRGRPGRQRAARQGAHTKFQQRMEGLKR